MEKNEQYKIDIIDVSTSGEGIGRIDGVVTFVPGLIPGDKATVEIRDIKKNLAHGFVVSIDEPSPDRVEPQCQYFDRCGGCTLQNMSYDAQLRLKEKQLRDKLERIYGGDAPEIEPIVGMESPWHYRNKAAYSVYAGKAILQKDGSVKNAERPRVGFFDGKGRNIAECMECPIQSESAEKAADALREYIKRTGISVYDDRTKKGRLRQMVVRTGFESHEVMVTLVINGKKVPQKELLADLMFDAIDTLNDGVAHRMQLAVQKAGYKSPYVLKEGCSNKMLNADMEKINANLPIEFEDIEYVLDSDKNPEINYDLLEEVGFEESWYELKSLIINYNSSPSLAEISVKMDVVYGMPVITDSSAGLEFEISPFSFYQVNPVQMEKLYGTVLEFADLKGDETVFDLYCGVGTIGLYCARSARYVWGIESVKSAIVDANRNAVINGMVNIQFVHGKAEDKIFELIGETKPGTDDDKSNSSKAAVNIADGNTDSLSDIAADSDSAPENKAKADAPDLIIMDPPRAGCKPELLHAVVKAAPEKIIYVSCDAGTLARDLKILTGMSQADDGSADTAASGAKYEIKRIRQIDQFCHSTHVETVVLLGRENVDEVQYAYIDYETKDAEYLKGIKGSATYKEIKAWIKQEYDMNVTNLYIAQIKDKCGFAKRDNYNIGSESGKVPICPPEKEKAILGAFKHFGMM